MCINEYMENQRIIDRNLLASFIEYAVDKKVSKLEWERFMVNHYSDSQMENARRECVKCLGGHAELKSNAIKEKLFAIARDLRENT
jgi:hypothetical protein